MTKLEKAYVLLAKNCGIKKGDTVKVLRTFNSHELGTNLSHRDSKHKEELKALVGESGKITCITSEGGFHLRLPLPNGETERWCLPFFILEKVADATPEIVLTIDGKEVEISEETLENIRKEL